MLRNVTQVDTSGDWSPLVIKKRRAASPCSSPYAPASTQRGSSKGEEQVVLLSTRAWASLLPATSNVLRWGDLRLPGTWTDLTKTSWDNNLPPDWPGCVWLSQLVEEASRCSYQSPAPLNRPCGLVAFVPLCTPWKPSVLNVVIREGMELVCNVFQSHDISSLIFNGHAYT